MGFNARSPKGDRWLAVLITGLTVCILVSGFEIARWGSDFDIRSGGKDVFAERFIR